MRRKSREDSRKHAKSREVTWAESVATDISEPDVSSTCGEAHGSCSHLSDADGSKTTARFDWMDPGTQTSSLDPKIFPPLSKDFTDSFTDSLLHGEKEAVKEKVSSFIKSALSGRENEEDLVRQYLAYQHSNPNEDLQKGLEIAGYIVAKSSYSSESRIDIETALAKAQDRFG